MTRKEARNLLLKVYKASKSPQPMTRIGEVLGMNPEWYDTMDDWQDALTVRLADLKRTANYD